LNSNGSERTCIRSGLATFLHCACTAHPDLVVARCNYVEPQLNPSVRPKGCLNFLSPAAPAPASRTRGCGTGHRSPPWECSFLLRPRARCRRCPVIVRGEPGHHRVAVAAQTLVIDQRRVQRLEHPAQPLRPLRDGDELTEADEITADAED